MTYEYQDLITGEVFEVQQRISEPAFTHRIGEKLLRVAQEHEAAELPPLEQSFTLSEQKAHPVKRLISAQSGGFRLVSGDSGGWSESGYGHTPGQLSAMRTLGRKLHRPVS